MSYTYPIFLLLLVLMATHLKYNETGWDDWGIESYLKAQEKLKKKWARREKIREMKREAEGQLEKEKNAKLEREKKKKEEKDVG